MQNIRIKYQWKECSTPISCKIFSEGVVDKSKVGITYWRLL